MADDPAELGRKMAEANKPDPDSIAASAVVVTMLGYVLKMLVDEQCLNEGKVVAEIERISADMMRASAWTAKYVVAHMQTIRAIVEGKYQQPS